MQPAILLTPPHRQGDRERAGLGAMVFKMAGWGDVFDAGMWGWEHCVFWLVQILTEETFEQYLVKKATREIVYIGGIYHACLFKRSIIWWHVCLSCIPYPTHIYIHVCTPSVLASGK